MIWERERYIAHSLFEDTGREMFCELFGPLHALEAEWKQQGASAAEIGMTAFDWDYVLQVWLSGSCGAMAGIYRRFWKIRRNSRLASIIWGAKPN